MEKLIRCQTCTYFNFGLNITCLLAITRIGTLSILWSPNNCLRVETARESLWESEVASTINTKRSVSWRKLLQYCLVSSAPPTVNKKFFYSNKGT